MKFEEITGKIIGYAMKVHSVMGCGFQELIYQRCMAIEMRDNTMQFIREHDMPVYYNDRQVGTRRVDFFVEDCIMVELKAVKELDDVHIAQALNYLEAYNAEVGLLLNFGGKSLEYKRLYNKKLKRF